MDGHFYFAIGLVVFTFALCFLYREENKNH